MTRFLFNQFSKQFLEEFLTPLGIVECSREVSIQSALEAYASEMDLSPNTVVQLAISFFLELADISVETSDQNSPDVPSKQGVLALLPLSLQKGIEQYAIEYEFPPEFVVEMSVTFLLDPDASSFVDYQVGVQKDRVCLLQQYYEAHQSGAVGDRLEYAAIGYAPVELYSTVLGLLNFCLSSINSSFALNFCLSPINSGCIEEKVRATFLGFPLKFDTEDDISTSVHQSC